MKKMQQNHNKILVELINKTNSQNSKKFFKELDLKVKKIIGHKLFTLMVVDKSLTPKNQSIVVASINGELVVKKFLKDKQGKCYLKSENENYPKIILDSKMETTIWGVATYVIHNLS